LIERILFTMGRLNSKRRGLVSYGGKIMTYALLGVSVVTLVGVVLLSTVFAQELLPGSVVQ
jgi:hypothetical protein